MLLVSFFPPRKPATPTPVKSGDASEQQLAAKPQLFTATLYSVGTKPQACHRISHPSYLEIFERVSAPSRTKSDAPD